MKYYPILLSKTGELIALKNLSQNIKDEIAPLIEVMYSSLIKTTKEGKIVEKETLEKNLSKNWSFKGNQILLDFSLFDDIDKKLTIIRKLVNNLFNNGVNVIPVIHPNSSLLYINLVKDLINNRNCKICIRTSNHTGGFINYNNEISNILSQLSISEKETLLLLDLGFTDKNNYINFATLIINTISNIPHINKWSEIIVASGSFPYLLLDMTAGKTYTMQRYEWDIWALLNKEIPLKEKIKYSDFGTKHPFYIPSDFQGTSSIKYTTADKFVIYRGKKPGNHPRSMKQYIDKARILITDPYYSGKKFSWGDEQIFLIANNDEHSGNATTWVSISQNHHITLLHSLL